MDKNCLEIRHLVLALSQAGFAYSKMQKVFERLGENASIKTFKKVNFVKEGLLKEKDCQDLLPFLDDNLSITCELNFSNKKIKFVTKFDDDYPAKLRDLPESPFILYYMGDLKLVDTQTLAVVGTRSPTNYGKDLTDRITRTVAKQGVTIVSGLALGTDSIAHRATLDVGGKTIAVLGGGFYHIYPQMHRDLARQIYQKGLLLTEYSPNTSAVKFNFPFRNRIIAGLSDGVLITEAEFKSGTIHTKDYALEYGKNMYALPGNVLSVKSDLPNELIKTGQAGLITCGEDILQDYKVSTKCEQQSMEKYFNLEPNELKIVEELKSGASLIDEIVEKTKLDAKIFNTYLTTLEISGIIKRLPGGYISLG